MATQVAGITSIAPRARRAAAPEVQVWVSDDALQARPEISRIMRQADAARGDGQRRAERKLPDEEKRQQPAQRFGAVDFLEVTIRSAGAGHGRAQLGPDQTVAEREDRAEIQPSMACGPPAAAMTSGRVMNGPTPIMSIMFSVVASARPMPRTTGLAITRRRRATIPEVVPDYLGSCPTLSRFT